MLRTIFAVAIFFAVAAGHAPTANATFIDLAPQNFALSGPAIDGQAVSVSADIFNLGDMQVQSTALTPLQVRLTSPQADLNTNGDILDILSFPLGTVIDPGQFATIVFTWIPDITQGVTQLALFADPISVFSTKATNPTIRSSCPSASSKPRYRSPNRLHCLSISRV